MDNVLIILIIIFLIIISQKHIVENFIEDREDGHTYIAPTVKDKNVNIEGNTILKNDLQILGDLKNKHNQNIIPKGMIVMWSGDVNAIPLGWALCDGNNGTPDLRGRFIASINPNHGGWKVPAPHNPPFGNGLVKLHINNMPVHNHNGVTGVTNTNHTHHGKTHSMNRNAAHAHGFMDAYFAEAWGYTNTGTRFTGTGSGDSDGDNWTYEYSDNTNATDTNHEHDFTTRLMNHNSSHSHSIASQGLGHAFDARPYFYALAFIMKL